MTTTNGTKYTFVCDLDECDSLVELTTVDGFGFPNGVVRNICPCGREMSYISATILSSEQPTTKEEQMETTIAETYNPSLLVTYKKIDGDEISYPTEKVSDIEWALDQSRRNYKTLTEKQNAWYTKESKLRSLLEEVYENSDDQESLASIAEIFDIPLTKEIEYTAWVRVDMTVEIELGGDVDAVEDFIAQNLTVDSYDSLISVNNYEVDRVEEGTY
jgi:hypothetical protein